MLKLYFKKLLLTFLSVVCYVFIAAFIIFLLYLLLPKVPEVVLALIALALALPIGLKIILWIRNDNKAIKREYWERTHDAPLSFGKDFVQTLKSRENTIHTLAFLTLAELRGIRISILANTPFWGVVLDAIIIILTQVLVFALINTLLWCWVQRRWARQWANANQMLENKELNL